MDRLDSLPDGIASRIRQMQDDEDDEVDYNIPSKWGVNHAADVFRSEVMSSHSNSSTSNAFGSSNTSRGFAPALASLNQRRDPYEARHVSGFSFSSVTPNAPESATWDTYDPDDPGQSENSLTSQATISQANKERQSNLAGERGDVHDPRNRALEGTFSSTSVRRVTDEGSEWRDLSLPDLDSRLENPDLDIDANVRANFIPTTQLYRARPQPSASALRNPTLIASNTGGTISTIVAGETVTYIPQSGDHRLGMLDRHGNYLGNYKGEIKKSRLRQYREDVKERDRQMLQATAEYRELAAMSAEDRADLLERLRKPYEWQGAFPEDQYDERQVPEVYSRKTPTDRVLNWMADEFSQISIQSASPGSTLAGPTRPVNNNNNTTLGELGGFDDFTSNSAFISLGTPRPRSQQYLRDLLHYGKSRWPRKSTPQGSSSVYSQATVRFDQASFNSAVSGRFSNVSTPSRGLDDAFSFDDSPEFQFPDDCPIESELTMSSEQLRDYKSAISLSERYGRVVLVHLHQLVKFTPGAIASRIFGGIIQEIQLFPVQRVAIVIFLHPYEAQAFVRHVKKMRECGREEEIRALQIEVGWNKGIEYPYSILPVQPQILAHHVTSEATRCLRLHHLPVNKTKERVSSELGLRLSMPLLTVILCAPKLDIVRTGRATQVYQDNRFDDDAPLGAEARLGRQAIVEFVSINDAIRARKLLDGGMIDEYEECEPVFASDPCAGLGTERSYCTCAGCKDIRKARASND